MSNYHKIPIVGCLMIVCMSCASLPKTTYQDNGFHFEITEDFRIGRSDFTKKNKSTYIPIYSRDKNVYAKLSIIWLPVACDLDWELWNYSDGLTCAYEKSDPQNRPEFSEYKSAKFGKNLARKVEYVVPYDGPRIGSYTVFRCDSISVIIGVHSVLEGKEKIDKCVAMIEQTHRCTYQGRMEPRLSERKAK